MMLEDEIKQNKFRNEFQKLAVNIIYTHSWLNSKQAEVFKNFEITNAQYNVLRILRGQYPKAVPVSLVRERMLDKMSDASRLVERLRQKDLLKRETCSEDRRKMNVLITEKGLTLLENLDKYDDQFDSYFNKITKDEAEQINELLDKIRD